MVNKEKNEDRSRHDKQGLKAGLFHGPLKKANLEKTIRGEFLTSRFLTIQFLLAILLAVTLAQKIHIQDF